MGEDGRAMSPATSLRPAPRSAAAGVPAAGTPLATRAALAGAAAALIGLVVCMSVALTGWFLADAGSHGDTTDALRVGAVAWLAGHGSRLVLAGAPLGIAPLAVTMMLVLTAFRAGRWAAARSDEDRAGLPMAAATFTCAYVVVAVVTCVVASQPGATPVLGRAVLGALAVAALAGGCGLAVGGGRHQELVDRLPAWVTDVVTGALASVLWLVAGSAVLVGGSLLLSFNEAATVLSRLHLGVGEALSYTVVMALFAPNAVLLGTAYLVGPGFAFGTGTTVSPTAVSLGVVPAYPVLAALPGEGPTPGWLVLLLGVPVLAAAAGAGSGVARREALPHDVAALRGAASGFVAGLLVTLLVALAGGPLGTGRMADVGAPVAEVLVFATGLMSVGGMLGALVRNWWRRRRGEPVPSVGGDAEDAVEDTEATVEVRRH
jgi:hypothetical protein